MAPKTPKAPKDPNAPKRVAVKTNLRKEIERVAKATGLPVAYISKRVAVEKKRIDEDRKAALDNLAARVADVVAAAVAEINVAPAEPQAPPVG